MKISIPNRFKSKLAFIKCIYLEANSDKDSYKQILSKNEIKNSEFINIPENVYDSANEILYRVIYKNKYTDILKYPSKEFAIYKGNQSNQFFESHRIQESTIFLNSKKGQLDCLVNLDQKIIIASKIDEKPIGSNNLIYYSIYFDNGYIDLLEISLRSILNHAKQTFDILLITDKKTKEKIHENPFLKNINFLYHITETPFDGVMASQNKTKIFEFKNINDYQHILYLDCDIVVTSDINQILAEKLESNKLYTARNINLFYGHLRTIHYGFEILSDAFIDEMLQKKQPPFNAGQFLFQNSLRMREHFMNLIWLMNNWPGEFFFEQTFLCYYFCKAALTDDTILHPRTFITSTLSEFNLHQASKAILVHFANPPLDAVTKKKFMTDFYLTNK